MPGPFQFSDQLQLLTDQLCQDSSVLFFEKVNMTDILKVVNASYYKWQDLALS